jgi:hypothetical protein
MTTETLQFIGDEFPYADPMCPPPIGMLVRAYNELRDRSIDFEKAAIKVARLNPNAGEIGAGMLVMIVEEAQAALNP